MDQSTKGNIGPKACQLAPSSAQIRSMLAIVGRPMRGQLVFANLKVLAQNYAARKVYLLQQGFDQRPGIKIESYSR